MRVCVTSGTSSFPLQQHATTPTLPSIFEALRYGTFKVPLSTQQLVSETQSRNQESGGRRSCVYLFVFYFQLWRVRANAVELAVTFLPLVPLFPIDSENSQVYRNGHNFAYLNGHNGYPVPKVQPG